MGEATLETHGLQQTLNVLIMWHKPCVQCTRSQKWQWTMMGHTNSALHHHGAWQAQAATMAI